MKFVVDKTNFLDSLKKVNSVIEKKTTASKLSNIYIKNDPENSDQIIITGTDYETSYFGRVRCESVSEFGEVVVNGKSFFDAVKVMPGSKIEVSLVENKIYIKSKNSVFNLNIFDVEDFPEIEEAKDVSFLQIPLKVFEKMIKSTSFSVSIDTSRLNLCGVYFNVSLNEDNFDLTMVSTDGHRLSKIEAQVLGGIDMPSVEGSVIIHKKGISIIKTMLESNAQYVLVGFHKKQLIFKVKNSIVNIKPIDEQFPAYDGVIPPIFPIICNVNRKELIDVLKRVSVMNDQNNRSVKFNITDNKIDIFASNPVLGEAKDSILVDYSGDEFLSAYNYQFLVEALDAIEVNKVNLNFIDQKGPFKIVPASDEHILIEVGNNKKQDYKFDLVYIVMPMKF